MSRNIKFATQAEIFVSYSRADKDRILPVVDYLKNSGITLWFDEYNIHGASFWSAEIVEAIENCKVILLFLSQNAAQSNNVLKELHLGLEKSKNILPILLESIEIPRSLKYVLAGIQFIDTTVEHSDCLAAITSSLRHVGITFHANYNSTEDKLLDNQIQIALTRLQLPPTIYLVRKNIVEDIARKIISGKLPITIIQGLPGTGKTTVCCEVLKQISKNFELIFAFNFSGPHAYEPAYFIEELNLSLQRSDRNVPNKQLESYTSERALEVLLMQIPDITSVFILDNLDRLDLIWQRFLIKILSTLPKIKVLITVTTRPEGIEQFHLITLDTFEKREVIEFINESKLLPEKIKVNEILDRLPISIYSNPGFLITLLSQLKDFPLDIILNQGLNEIAEEATNIINRVLGLLSNDEIEILVLVAMLPEQDIKKSFDLLKIEIHVSIFKSLKLLIARSLLIRVDKGYVVPEMVFFVLGQKYLQEIVTTATKLTNNWCEAIHSVLNLPTNLSELASMGAGMSYALYKWQLYDQLSQLVLESNLEVLNMAGIWKEYSTILNFGIKAAKLQCDANNEILLSCRLARKHYQLGNYEGAKQLIEECKLLVPEKDQSKISAILQNHQIFLFDQNQFPEKALHELYRSRKLYKKLSDNLGLSKVERLIGQTYLRLKNYKKARSALIKALAFFAANIVTKEKVEILIDLALCDLETGRGDIAEKRLLIAIKYCKSMNYESGLPRAFLILSQTLCTLARYEEASNAADQATYYGERLNKNVYFTALLIKSKLGFIINN